jgi:DNA-binding LacI/PurR family transcriptional regulator
MDPASSFEGDWTARGGCWRRPPFSAVLAFDDLTALGVVRGLTEAGLRVPEDCSVLGFDDVLPAAVATPGITTIRQPLKEMGCWRPSGCWKLSRRGSTELCSRGKLFQAQPELVVRMSQPGAREEVREKSGK